MVQGPKARTTSTSAAMPSKTDDDARAGGPVGDARAPGSEPEAAGPDDAGQEPGSEGTPAREGSGADLSEGQDGSWNEGDGDTGEVARLRGELEVAKETAQRMEDRFLRARADYDNLLKRLEREREDARRAAAARVAEAVIAPVESLERALLDFAADADDARVRGLHMAVRQLRDLLEREGLEPVPGAGAMFDHTVHEAVAQEAAQAPAGTILEVVRTGYRLNGRLLRPALVKVSAGPPDAASREEE